MDEVDGWAGIDASALADLADVWIPVGVPGYAGDSKARWQTILDDRFGPDGWRMAHIVRGRVVSRAAAIVEYEEAYRVFLRDRPALVEFLTTVCGNVYDDNVTNVHDADYDQPHTAMNHYQDISVRRVIAGLVDDPDWPSVTDTDTAPTDLIDLGTGQTHRLPRATGLPRRPPAADPRPAVARLRPEPRRRADPRPGAHHVAAEPDGLVSRRGLRPPVGRGVLADEQGRRGPLRPVPRTGGRSRRIRSPASDGAMTPSSTLLFGALSRDIYLDRDLVLPGGGVLNMAWAWSPGRRAVPSR